MRICLGDITERIIHYSTLGLGKKLATSISKWLGFESCGCSERQTKLNHLGNCYKGIEL